MKNLRYIILLALLGAGVTLSSEKAVAASTGYAFCVYSIGALGGVVPTLIKNCNDGLGNWSGWMPAYD